MPFSKPFIVDFVEVYAQTLVGLVKSGIHPRVHRAPQRTHLLVAGFPAAEHLASLLHQWRRCLCLFLGHAFLLEFLHFGFIVLVESHIEITDKVVALLAGRFRSSAVAPLLPCEHRFADMDAAIVHDIGFHHLVAIGLHDARQAVAKQVVAHVAEVKRLVGVWRRIFNHHQLAVVVGGLEAIVFCCVDMVEHSEPEFRLYSDVEEALYHVILLHRLAVGNEIIAYLLGCCVGCFVRRFQEREYHYCKVAFKLFFRCLRHNG